jgi:hypothetical protein
MAAIIKLFSQFNCLGGRNGSAVDVSSEALLFRGPSATDAPSASLLAVRMPGRLPLRGGDVICYENKDSISYFVADLCISAAHVREVEAAAVD